MKKDYLFIILILPFLLVIGLVLINNKPSVKPFVPTNIVDRINESSESTNTENMNPEKKNYLATLNTTAGVIKIKLNGNSTPVTASNFVKLSREGFYNNTIFHRVISGFMIQGGDPKGDGTGGPGYSFADEPFEGEYTRGTVAMANSGPNTNGSQFFIMHQSNPLPKNYVIFGEVTEGMETVDKIANSEVIMGSTGEKSKPVNPVKILTVDVEDL